MFIKYFFGGFLAKTVASFDDAITRIPVVAQLTKTRKGRIAFSIGNLLAVTVAIAIAWFFSSLLEKIPYAHVIASALILLLAIAVYFDLFEGKVTKQVGKQEEKMSEQIFGAKFFRIMLSGFIISFVTLLDDIIVLTTVFLGSLKTDFYAMLGMYASTIIQLIIMIRLAEKLSKFKYIKETAIAGLLILAVLVYLQVF